MKRARMRTATLLAVCMAAACAAPSAALGGTADNGQYPVDPGARTFNGGLNGWTSTSSAEGVCGPPVVCASVTNSYVAAGDADGNGYIASEYLGAAGVGAVAGTTTGIWESPAFTYRSAGGEPETAYLSLSRRANVGQLLAVPGDSAEYAVELVDASEGGRTVPVIAPTSMAGAPSWTTVPRATIRAGRLRSGDSYRLRIESRFQTGTGALVTGSANYDNVVLRTAAAEAANGAGGNEAGGKGGGRSELRSAELLSLFGSGQSNTATVTGAGKARAVRVRVSCPKRIGAACRVVAQGLLRKHRPATAKRRVRLGSGRHRLVVLRVKPKARAKVAKRKRLLVSERVTVGKTSATAYKVRKLVRR